MAKTKKKISIDELQRQRGIKTLPYARVLFILLVVLAIIGSLIAVALSVGKANEVPESEQITRSLSGKTLAEDRESAIVAVGALLEATKAPATISEAGDTIGKLESGDFSDLAPGFAERIRYYDSYADNSDFQAQVAMATYSIAALAKEANGGQIVADGAKSGTVRIDQETGIAQVPIDIFTGQDSPIALQMVYVDGDWKLEPHSFMSYIALSAQLQSNSGS